MNKYTVRVEKVHVYEVEADGYSEDDASEKVSENPELYLRNYGEPDEVYFNIDPCEVTP